MQNRRSDYTYSSNTDTSVIYGLLQYTDRKDLSLVDVMGYTGHAFRIIINEETVDVSSYSGFDWPLQHRRSLLNLGFQSVTKGGPTLTPPTPEQLVEGLSIIHESLDRGIPILSWDLFIPEFGIIYGYDDTTRKLRCRDVRNDNELPYDHLGRGQVGEMYVLAITEAIPTNRVSMLKTALEIAIEHAEHQQPGFAQTPNRNGLAAYDCWQQAFRLRKVDAFGNAVNADKICDARQFAAEFLHQLSNRWHGEHQDDLTIRGLLKQAAECYDSVADHLAEISAMFPFPDGGSPNEDEQAEAAIALLQSAKTAENEGIGVIKNLIDVLEHYRGDRDIANSLHASHGVNEDEFLFESIRELRMETLKELESLTNDIIDYIPAGSKTSIRWHAGHILVGWDHAIFPTLLEPWRMPQHYHYLFPRGTKPADWQSAPPAWSEMLEKIRTQSSEIVEACRGKMEEPLPKPFLNILNLRGMVQFMLRVETKQLGTIRRIKKSFIKNNR